MSKRLRIIHTTEHHYNEPVRFGVHRVLMRLREWLRNVYQPGTLVNTLELLKRLKRKMATTMGA